MKPHEAPPFTATQCPESTLGRTLDVRGFNQSRNYSCGFASTLMIARYFGNSVPGQQLFEKLGTARDGTRQNAIVRVLRALGIRANLRYDVDYTRLCREIDRGKPLIGYLADVEHWLVIYGYAREPDRVFVADPRPEEHQCVHHWDEYGERLGGFGIVCSRAPARPIAPGVPQREPAAEEFDELPERVHSEQLLLF